MRSLIAFSRLAVSAAIACGAGALAQQQRMMTATVNTIHKFTDTPDGSNPAGNLVSDSAGALYGTTAGGGTNGPGTVFRLTPPASAGGAWAETVLYSFAGGENGGEPAGGLVIDSLGNLYGATYTGGNVACVGGCGLVFQLSLPSTPGGTWSYHVLYSFSGGTDGYAPQGALVFDQAGALYGAASMGGDLVACTGATPGCGVIFQLAPPTSAGGAWTYSVIYTFTGASDGIGPLGNLVFGRDGALYGVTGGGGTGSCYSASSGCGTVFALTPPSSAGGAWTETQLYLFTDGSDGANPSPSLVWDSRGVLYGAATWGGSRRTSWCTFGCGTIYQLTPPAHSGGSWTFSTIFTFRGFFQDGSTPCCLVFSNTGELYGAAQQGGPNRGSNHYGAIYRLRPPSAAGGAWTENILYGLPRQGNWPSGLVLVAGPGGVLYGTTSGGLILGEHGTAFQLIP